jgi:hypothetical protein
MATVTVLFPKAEPSLGLCWEGCFWPKDQGHAGQGWMGGASGQGGRQVLDNISHGFHLQLLPICRLDLVEGGVGADDHQGGSCRTSGSLKPPPLLVPTVNPHHSDPGTHPGPRRQRSLHQPARKKGRRLPQPERTDGPDLPLDLGADGIGQSFPL